MTSPRILVIDDEEDISTLVKIILTEAGYTVLQAFSGQQGLHTLQSQPVDLVLLDIMLPDMNGWEVCRRIRENERTADVPVLYFTVRNQVLDVDRQEWALADGNQSKPFEPQELVEKVRRHAGKRHMAE